MISRNAKRAVTLSISFLLIAAFCIFCLFSCRQSGETIRQIAGLNSRQVSSVVISYNSQTMSLTDKDQIDTFLRLFADNYRLNQNKSAAGSPGSDGYMIRLNLDGQSDTVVIHVSLSGPVVVSSTLFTDSQTYNLIDKAAFIHNLNTYADSVDPHWVGYAGSL